VNGATVCLENIFLHVTKACNLRCAYCYFSASMPMPDELTTTQFASLWPQIVAIRPVKVVFTGGEPLLRHDLLNMLRGLQEADREHRVLRCLNTNGRLVTPQFARQIVGLVDDIRVSLDAMRKRNDTLRGEGNFDDALHALDCFQAAGFEPKVLVTVTSLSLPDLGELLRFLVQRRITRVGLNGFRPIGRGARYHEWTVTLEELQPALQQVWSACFPDQSIPIARYGTDCQSHCGVGHFLNIMPNGDVFPCHVLTQPEFRCGNIREQGLHEICRRNGLLGDLSKLDFKELAKMDGRLQGLTRPGECMGTVYAKTKSSFVWQERLQMLTVTNNL